MNSVNNLTEKEIRNILKSSYSIEVIETNKLRQGGTTTFSIKSNSKEFFLKCISKAFSDTIITAIEVNIYLQNKDFPVPKIIHTNDLKPYIHFKEYYLVLYEYLKTQEINMEKDAEEVGALIGKLHQIMSEYPGVLIKRDKYFYIDRYIEILRKKNYSKIDEFIHYGNNLWEMIKDLPMGYCHGDMYCGNIERGEDGKLYLFDFDTSCVGFQLYDIALICNKTDYFKFDNNGYDKTKRIYKRIIQEYLKYNTLDDCSIKMICNLIALYHYTLQATIIEIYGLDCVDNIFFDNQLNWLIRWYKEYYTE